MVVMGMSLSLNLSNRQGTETNYYTLNGAPLKLFL